MSRGVLGLRRQDLLDGSKGFVGDACIGCFRSLARRDG